MNGGPVTRFGRGWGVRVHAASRLSFTLIDLNGSTGRRNGMASVSLRDPGLDAVVTATDLAEPDVTGQPLDYPGDVVKLLTELRDRFDGPTPRCRIGTALPPHRGFGSKTTTLLAVGKAYAALCGVEMSTAELAAVCGRGGTSGASVNLIDRGGFLVDGGHANPDDFTEDPHRYLLPSRFARSARKPPVLINLPFPPWPILVISAAGVHLNGKQELDWFQRVLPIPYEEACRTTHLVTLNLAPAIAEADYPAFCRALDRLTFETYYKQKQISTQSDEVTRVLTEGRTRSDVDAIAMSSNGPTCFAFTRNPAGAVAWLTGLREQGVVEDFFFTTAQNEPVRLQGVPVLDEEV